MDIIQKSQQSNKPTSIIANELADEVLKIENPISTNDFWGFVGMVADIAIKIGVPVSVCYFIWAGFQYVAASGNQAKIQIAHRNFKYVVIGTAIFLGAWSIVELIIKTFQSVTGTG